MYFASDIKNQMLICSFDHYCVKDEQYFLERSQLDIHFIKRMGYTLQCELEQPKTPLIKLNEYNYSYHFWRLKKVKIDLYFKKRVNNK